MTESIFNKQVPSLDIVQSFDPHTEESPFSNHPAELASLVAQTPTGNPIALIGPQEKSIVQEAPMEKTIVYTDSIGETQPHNGLPISNFDAETAIFSQDEAKALHQRWNTIQGTFVDEPRTAIEQADALIVEVAEKITRMFSSEHSALENEWSQGKDVSTEDLRKALQHYHAFFNRLVVS